MKKDKSWKELNKSEKEKVGSTVAATGILMFWKSLTTAGKWSVFRWLFIAWFYFGFVVDSYEGEIWDLPNWMRIIIVIHIFIGGPIILYVFRNKFFK